LKKRLRNLSPEVLRSNVAAWFRDRVDFEPVRALAAKKTVPVHRHSWIYLLGGTALFLFVLQVLSGVLLMLYYQPTEAGAYQSVQRIMTTVPLDLPTAAGGRQTVQPIPLGGLVRSVHAWGANFFIAVVALHFLVKLFTRAYRKPRELTWVSGMLLLFLALAFGFSGYLLPWNELSYYATRAGTEIPGSIPLVGDWAVQFLRGGQYVTGDTITRFYAAHVMLLPLLCSLFLAVHLALIQAQGMSRPLGMAKEEVRDAMPFFSEFMLIELSIWLLVFGVIVTLATFMPTEVGIEADRLGDTHEGVTPEWYFLFMFQTFKILDPAALHVDGELLEALGVLFFAAVAGFLIAAPFVDRRALREEKSPRLTMLFMLLVVYAAAFEIWAVVSAGIGHASATSASGGVSIAGNVVSLAMFWALIGFLVFYLHQLRKENTRIRRLYH